MPVKELQQAILRLFKQNPTKKYSARHIIEKLGIGNNKDSVQHALDQLESTGQLKAIQKAQFDAAAEKKAISEKSDSENIAPLSDGDQSIKAPLKERNIRTNRGNISEEKTSIRAEARKNRPQNGTFIGVVDVTRTGAGYIVCEGLEEDVYVNV